MSEAALRSSLKHAPHTVSGLERFLHEVGFSENLYRSAVERVGVLLGEAGLSVRVPVRGLYGTQRPSLVEYIGSYVAAVRAALAG